MHPQILKIAQKAGMYVDLNGTPWPRAMSAEESEAAYKKFAELIVRECMSTLEEKIYESIDNEGYEIRADLILKEHFGVDE